MRAPTHFRFARHQLHYRAALRCRRFQLEACDPREPLPRAASRPPAVAARAAGIGPFAMVSSRSRRCSRARSRASSARWETRCASAASSSIRSSTPRPSGRSTWGSTRRTGRPRRSTPRCCSRRCRWPRRPPPTTASRSRSFEEDGNGTSGLIAGAVGSNTGGTILDAAKDFLDKLKKIFDAIEELLTDPLNIVELFTRADETFPRADGARDAERGCQPVRHRHVVERGPGAQLHSGRCPAGGQVRGLAPLGRPELRTPA